MNATTIKAGRCYLRALSIMRSSPFKGPDAFKADRTWVLAGRMLASAMTRVGLDPLRDVDGILRGAGMPEVYRGEIAHTVGHAEASMFSAIKVMPGMIAQWVREGAYGI